MLGSRRRGDAARRQWRAGLELSPSRWLAGSFAGLIGLGAAGFLWLPGVTREPLSALDALFMATSAVCITGLAVIDPGTRLTLAGQLWLLLLIQLGGIGILTFTALVVRAVGRRTSLEVEEIVGGSAAVVTSTPAELLRAVLLTTLAVELGGTLLLGLLWAPRLGWDAAWPALFHAISAFCNAGFSTFSDSLAGFASSPLTLLVMGALVVLGSMGFPVIEDLRLRRAGRRKQLALSTRLSLYTSAILIAAGSASYLLFESQNLLAPFGPIDRFANALFMAVTPRTAGFATVDYDSATNAGYLMTLGLMWIGGSPASMAGGAKTTTIALLVLLVWSRLRGNEYVTIGARTVPDLTLKRAVGLALAMVVLLVLATVALLGAEAPGAGEDRARFVRVVFEAQSALATAGLSMNLTPTLSAAGKVVIVVCMFVGRIGPIALFDALSRAPRRSGIRLAREDVLVG